jgi:hypothetical protein
MLQAMTHAGEASDRPAPTATRSREWRCRWCSRWNLPTRQHYCEHCWNGRTQAIEDSLKDKLGLPRVTLTRRSR